ncbi:hypothetical protein BGW38_010266, partial [Lunasporangiospora selenospora]
MYSKNNTRQQVYSIRRAIRCLLGSVRAAPIDASSNSIASAVAGAVDSAASGADANAIPIGGASPGAGANPGALTGSDIQDRTRRLTRVGAAAAPVVATGSGANIDPMAAAGAAGDISPET